MSTRQLLREVTSFRPGPRVVLYTPAALVARSRPDNLSGVSKAKRSLRRGIDRVVWRTIGRLIAHHYHYAPLGASNRGDEAIRVAIEEDLRRTLPTGTEISEVLWGDPGAALQDGRLSNFDMFVIGGGGYYRFMANGDLHPLLAADIEAMTRIGKPIGMLGSGVNYNIRPEQSGVWQLTPSARRLLARHLDQLEFCIVRDNFSRDVMQPLTHRPVQVGADPVLFLEPRPAPQRHAGPLRVGFNVAFHGPNAESVLRLALAPMVKLLRTVRDRYRATFTYFVHFETETGIVRLLRDSGIPVDVVDADPRTLADAYARIDVHLCQMMHSSIMSMRCGVPTLVVAYDQKHHSFFDLLQQSRYCLSVHEATADVLTRRFDELIEGRERISSEIQRRTAILEGEYRRLLLQIGTCFSQGAVRSIA